MMDSGWFGSDAALWTGGALFPLAVGLGSSFTHCAGMCGPIHLFLASRPGAPVWRYHAGRILGYGILGATLGSAGQAVSGLSSPAFRIAGGALLALAYALFGLGLLGWKPRALDLERSLGRLFPARFLGRAAAGGAKPSLLFPAGLAASLLPCPSTHAVLLWGVGLGNAGKAAGGMILLGIATLPVFALLPRRALRHIGAGRGRLPYQAILGAIFLGLTAWRIYGLAAHGPAACH